MSRYKFRGSSGKVNLALSGLPEFTCLKHDKGLVLRATRGAISISPSIEYLERAYDDAKYGEFSRNPYMDIVIPSMIDPGMAPPGKHVMSIFVQYAPYNLNGGWNDAKRDAFGDAVIKTLARYAPNIKSLILHRQVLTPRTSSASPDCPRATSSRASWRCTSSSSCGRSRSGRSTARRCAATGSAARARTPAAASWAHPDGSRRSRSSGGVSNTTPS